MVADAAAERRLSYDEYLALERSTDTRHELYDGRAWAMASGTPAHSAVKANVIHALGNALVGKPCREFDSDLKVQVEASGLATYPDASVICGPLVRAKNDDNAVVNPTVIVEVISPSTRDWDTGGKFAHYRRIETLREVLFVSPEERTVEHHWKNDDGTWQLKDFRTPEPIPLSSIAVTLTFDQLFERLDDTA
jgi:Uma2 family endonuclease